MSHHLRIRRKKRVFDSPNRRYWFPKKTTEMNGPGFKFTVMSYNILSDSLMAFHTELYRGCKNDDLIWINRWPRILKEIRSISPDVLALQEAQSDHYVTNIYPDLKTLNYEGSFKKRTGNKSDGVALFYKPSRLKLQDIISLEFNQNRVGLDRDNVALIGQFQTKGNQSFILATTHLLFNPKRSDVRLAQTALLLAELQRLSFVNLSKFSPVIIAGDFNFTPNSMEHNFWMNGKAKFKQNISFGLRSIGLTSNCVHEHVEKYQHETGSSLANKSPHFIDRSARLFNPLKVPYNPYEAPFEEINHNFSFNSIETLDQGVTCKHDDRWRRVDYLFYSSSKSSMLYGKNEGKLKLVQVLRSPMSKGLKGLRIPSKMFPSDHISQAAKFILLK
ncbi:protein angel homolog 2 isoform X2 [Lepeophtheirus salmonis]|uniref:protein angel homolog 2 isoform X2 n=1 Tax=Lepeophtheirus salmonis TaxID=72036 RepID=UPI001AE4CEF3|nr:protein angel homolog 2-like isoform X2 [Lepeophtheirus salmonis]